MAIDPTKFERSTTPTRRSVQLYLSEEVLQMVAKLGSRFDMTPSRVVDTVLREAGPELLQIAQMASPEAASDE